jgi:hypothetical protein
VSVSPPEFGGELHLVEQVGAPAGVRDASGGLPVLKWVGAGLSFSLAAQA